MRRPIPNQFVEVRAGRLEGAPVAERRRWSDAFKDRAVAASLEPGVNISALARSLEIKLSIGTQSGPQIGAEKGPL
jgi:transposase